MLCRGLTLLLALSALAAGDGVNDTELAAVNTTTRGGQEDGSIMFEAPEEAMAAAAPGASWSGKVDGAVSRQVTQLMLRLQSALRERRPVDTLLFSPFSISGALHLLWLGARGTTALQLAAFLGGASPDLPLDAVLPSYRRFAHQLDRDSGSTQVHVANGLFLQYGYPVRTWFANASQEFFDTEVYGVEFASNGEAVASQINGWVSRKTKGRINKFLHSPLPVDTKVLIANAIYFNGEWEHPFPLETTLLRPYSIPKEEGEPEVLKLLMMTNSGELPYARSEELKCQVVGLPYKDKRVTMYLVLPTEKSLQAFRTLEQELTVEKMEKLRGAVQDTPVIISVPRMRIQATFHLRQVLEQLGVNALFDAAEADLGLMSPGKHVAQNTFSIDKDNSSSSSSSGNASTVDFPGKTKREADAVVADDNPGLFVDDMIHKVEIEVTETGTVASAVTAVTVTRDGSRIVLRFDRPFLFFIRHESTGLPLFWGSVLRPIT